MGEDAVSLVSENGETPASCERGGFQRGLGVPLRTRGTPASDRFSGPGGTFTEAALMQVPGARESERIPMASVPSALAAVREGAVDAAVVPIENSVEGGVTATLV